MNTLMNNPMRFTFFMLLLATIAKAEVKLPKILTSNMVLQREKPINIWGWANKGETVIVTFHNQTLKTKANSLGAWSVVLAPMSHGGPLEMTVKGKSNSITLKNILIGDVWVCSGQSNMEWIIRNTNNAAKEIAEGNYPSIRLFTVEKNMSMVPTTDLKGGEWLECNSKNIADFSAVAYFFGRKLTKELDVPIGLVNTSWGGTNIQTWMSWDVISTLDEFKSASPTEYEKSMRDQSVKQQKYDEALKNEKGTNEKWYNDTATDTGWKNIQLPGIWEQTEIGNTDGIIWFRKQIDVPSTVAGKEATLSLGPIDDWDETYVNGELIGKETEYSKNRIYKLNGLKAGKNFITIKVTDNQGGGGIYGKPELLYVEIDGQKISLTGEWQYKPSVLSLEYNVVRMGPNEFPSQLYNAMLAPLLKFNIKGAIWYQGESNTYQAYRYRTLFPTMISNWRNKWGYEFPFYWVQLANYMDASSKPVDSQWAELREAQSKTLSLPQTGQAVIIDIGEAKDIHPRNKQDVGYRLALAALKQTYNKDIVYSGPVYKSMKVENNKVLIYFSNTGGGLLAHNDKYNYIRGFAIAGADKNFVWAKAYIDNDQVVVYADDIKNPVAVRYAWSDNPDDANLFNQEGLPTCPFRTDDWKLTTQQ